MPHNNGLHLKLISHYTCHFDRLVISTRLIISTRLVISTQGEISLT
ncbi:MAG: hypothetical protein ABFS56_33145 [Pseudomonadota bacterium]